MTMDSIERKMKKDEIVPIGQISKGQKQML